MTVEDRIIKALKNSGDKLLMSELVDRVQTATISIKPTDVKTAVLRLISADRVDLTTDLRLQLRGQK
jgi:hypothetical protein